MFIWPGQRAKRGADGAHAKMSGGSKVYVANDPPSDQGCLLEEEKVAAHSFNSSSNQRQFETFSRLQRAHLDNAKAAGRRDRMRVTVPCLITALLAQLLFVAWLLIVYFTGHPIYFMQTLGMAAVPICMLALLPTDHWWTSVFVRLCGTYYIAGAGLCGLVALSAVAHPTGEDGHLPTAADSKIVEGYCTLGAFVWLTCFEFMLYYILIAAVYFIGGIAMWYVTFDWPCAALCA